MALTINPAVSRGQRGWLVDSASFFAGTLVGATASLAVCLAVVLALSTVVPPGLVVGTLVVVVVAAALHDLGLPVPLPYRQRQVPEVLRDLLPTSVVAFVFGAMLGVGFLTLFTYSTHLAVLVALPLLPSLGAMLAAVVVFALGKSLVLASVAGTTTLEEVPLRFRWSRTRIRVLRATTAALSLALAAAVAIDGGGALVR
jgi:hypothetical protein